ncbi:MAG: CocE/NonD family hydrolase, partial [Kutzneria sp.]|nr:CocE/NonD family hydrolase [Kutzneria sp.]
YLWRKAFFDAHLRGLGDGPDFGARVHLFLTGRNEWRSFDDFPPREVITQQWALSSGGKANTAGGDGLLRATEPCAGPPDEIRADPDMPVIPVMAHAFGNTLDIREIAAHAEVLVYTSDPLDEPVVIVGEPAVSVTVSYDSVDGDVAVWLAEQTSDGALTQLALGFLRLRYRGGPDREIPLEPGVPVRAEIPLTYVGHQVPAGSRLALLVGASMFPLVDPNPHTGEPVRTADTSHRVRMTVFHDTARVSTLRLPTLPMVSA